MNLALRTEGPYIAEDRSWLGSAHGTTATRTITLDISTFSAGGVHFTAGANGVIKSGTVLARISSTGLYGPYGGQAAEVQTATVTGTPTGGTFTLTYKGDTTGNIAYNATAAAVQTALEALPSLTPGDVTVTGSAGGPYTITFGGTQTGDVQAITASGAGLTGGSSPGVTMATTTAGGSAVTTGLQVAAGHLFSSIPVTATTDPDVGAALLEHGVVIESKLPTNHGLDAAAKQALKGQFIYR